MNRIIRILNPAAGHGDAALAENIERGNPDVIHKTTAVGDAESFAKQICSETPNAHFEIFGGDGTISEVVNGIMSAGAGGTASFAVIPTGSGNDFVRCFNGDAHGSAMIDLIKYNDKYCVNMINIGFDCDVVEKALKYKSRKFMTGSGAYMMGIAATLIKKLGHYLEVEYTLPDGSAETQSGELLLCSAANGPFCGGGIKAAPLALPTDGLFDFFRVRKVTRRKFVSLFSDYKKGTYINENGELKETFKGTLFYDKCRSMKIKSPEMICVDGEIVKVDGDVEISIAPSAVKYIY